MDFLFNDFLPGASALVALVAAFVQWRAYRRVKLAVRWFFFFGTLLAVYTAVGYGLVLAGVPLNTPLYFRWLLLALNGLFGGLAIWFTAAFEKHDR